MKKYIVALHVRFNTAATVGPVVQDIKALAEAEKQFLGVLYVFNEVGVLGLKCEKKLADKIRQMKAVASIHPDRPDFVR